ncbi:CoA ester lyase [Streptomyces thermoviolaceus subsp. thermoviolaceus]|uniref:CoA ester lyase n=1 Tax=Streptomyces thermoviolaceus subsp. thermoviolaceus TaxID=66860 RepID=A0ABX0YW13_STRTL|nr:CoA ester lyase [Streptomyces thermoviolaceus]NJP16524.1 CoA ester lyase [Streptomyces thermoviolaceus subsp. thermoviolaceus]WTD46503.1 CoA ester lyase [Streptomyces thermoviolaceus]GHB03989.1 CoA ester lyase [Streptomyces thermoviolaceus subsp. thermoviolaceus]
MTTPRAAGAARSWLYVPATRPDLLAKAMAGDADAVVLDLEDSVPAGRKDEARAHAVEAVTATWPKPLWIRVNQVRTPEGRADLDALAGTPVQGLRLPKCESPEEIRSVLDHVDAPLHLLLETALGVEHAFTLATAAPQVALLSLGEADLAADLRVNDPGALDWARARIVNASRAAGLPGPVQSVWTDVADVDGLTADTRHGQAYGFFGRSVVHPRQIPPVNAAFTPGPAQVEDARRLLDSLRRAEDTGSAAWLDDRGRFVDPAVVARARWVLDLAG